MIGDAMAIFKDTKQWRIISEQDARKVIEHAHPRWRLPIKILYHYGMRASEVLSITPNNLREGVLTVPRLKGCETPAHVLVPEIRDELLGLAAEKLQGARLFPHSRKCLWENIQAAGNRAGVDKAYLHPHSFRHAAGR